MTKNEHNDGKIDMLKEVKVKSNNQYQNLG